MDKTKTTCTKTLFGTLACTSILAIALIIAGIVLCSIQVTKINTESHDQKNGTKFVVNYADCLPVQLKFNKCEEVIATNSPCNCDLDFNLDQNLQGKVAVYAQIDNFAQDDSVVDQLFDKMEDSFRKCNLSKIDNSTPNTYCTPISDDIFNDIFTLNIYTSADENSALGRFSKSNSFDYLEMDYENLQRNRQNKIITVSMQPDSKNMELENGLEKGKYSLKMTYSPRTYNNTGRFIVFSTEHTATVTTPFSTSDGPNIIGIVALVVGFILGVMSIAVYMLRKRIPGLETCTAPDGPADNVPRNYRHQEALAEEKPLSSTNNDN